MDPRAMAPFGEALRAFQNGNPDAEVIFRRDDGVERHMPISHFFRESSAYTHIEREALARCRGPVLDTGAGTGIHTLELQQRGIQVTAIDICPQAVSVMRSRGVKDAVCSDVFTFGNSGFNTILLLGHGIGMTETLASMDRFLAHAHTILSHEGQILLDSLDAGLTDDPRNLSYHAANRTAGRYFGEVRMRFKFQDKAGPYCGWLHVDPQTLCSRAAAAGWQASIILREPDGDYLAQLKRKSDHETRIAPA